MSTTYVDLLRAAYATELSDEAWVDSLARRFRALVGPSVAVYMIRPDARPGERIGARATRGPRIQTMTQLLDTHEALSARFLRAAYGGGPFAELVSDRLRRDETQVLHEGTSRLLGGVRPTMAHGGDNIAGVYGGTLAGGCMLTTLEDCKLAPRSRWALRRVAAHIAAAYRLRTGPLGDPDAILDEAGHVLADAGKGALPRASLARAAGDIRAAEAAAATDPESAVAVWRGLVEGRWSVLRSVDRRGRRHLILRRNEIEDTQGRDERTRRISSVLALAARGHMNKFIAYELGLSPSTVATDLKEGLSRLGFRTRAELVKLGPGSFEPTP